MENKKELGIYIHIPFCKHKCIYCDFISFPDKLIYQEKYINKLLEEIENEKELFKKYKVTTIYFGGGTPSIIDSKFIINILDKLKKYIDFKDVEITIEVNPGTVNKEKLIEYFNSGINRLSIGLQTTNDKLLSELGRIHNYSEFLNTYENARKVGFKNINVDLMIGLPNQKIEDVKKSITEIINLKYGKPEHISVYSLIVEEGTKIYKLIEDKVMQLPDDELERMEYEYVKNSLELEGYIQYEISNFSLKGRKSKHNMNCWEQKEYIGFGVAAHSYIDKIRFSNTSDIESYLKLDYKKIKTVEEKQNKIEEEKEYMLIGLRKLEGITISKFKEKFGENPIYLFRKEIEKLVEEELLIVDLDNIKLTRKGLDFANLVWEEFI